MEMELVINEEAQWREWGWKWDGGGS